MDKDSMTSPKLKSMKICVIIPDPGIRPEFYNFAIWQMERQTVKPDHIFRIDHQKIDDKIDLVSRISVGIEYAQQAACDYAFIVEDDFYPADYIEQFSSLIDKFDFVGQVHTYYYHLLNRTWKKQDHPNRSSLFTTGFKVSALSKFNFSKLNPEERFLDLKLWEYASRKSRKFINAGALGIKHGIWQCLGKGHRMVYRNRDPDLSWLKSQVDEEAFEFYQGIIKKYGTKEVQERRA